jgi:fructose-specific phosphotransferase system IIC component
MKTTTPHFTFWIIAAAGLVWNLMGCLNYISQTNPETVAQMPEVYQAIIQGRPSWATAGFAIGVFGGAVGCILLWLRKQVAVPVLILSLAGVILTAIFTVMVFGFLPSMALSVLVAGALLWYATIARRVGWLA